MREYRKYLACTLSLLSLLSIDLHPIAYTNKTYMSIRTPHHYLPMKYTSWHRILKQGSSNENAWGGTLCTTPFYHTSTNDVDMGKYFGTNYRNVIKVDKPRENIDVQSDLIMHMWQHSATTPSWPNDYTPLTGTITFKPTHTAYGIYLSYNQELHNITDGLYFRVNIPFEHVENNLHSNIVTTSAYNGSTILDYFSGNYTNDDPENLQAALECLKICDVQSSSGVGDIELLLGYKLAEKKEHEVSGALRIIVPTGKAPKSKYLFEALVGNGDHWGIGTNFNASMNIHKGDSSSLECLVGLDYTYLFGSQEKRTLGFRNGITFIDDLREREDAPLRFPWEYYLLGAEKGKMGVFPLANVLTRDVSVRPGSKCQGHVSFAYHRNNTTLDFGYSCYAQEGEEIKLKECWDNEKYGVADIEYKTDVAFNPPANPNDFQGLGGWIRDYELDVTTPATPGFVKHAVHGAISYTLSEWESPFQMGCGFSIEWTHDNAGPVGYMLWAKFGGTF